MYLICVCFCLAGDRCQLNMNECDSNPCLNGGDCVDGVHNYTCICPSEFIGRHCDQELDPCSFSPCQNGASCVTTKSNSDFICKCLPGINSLLLILNNICVSDLGLVNFISFRL